MGGLSGLSLYTSVPPSIIPYDVPVCVKENYWEVGHAFGYVYPQTNKFVPAEHFAPVMEFGNDQYALSHVDNIMEIEKSHLKYAEVCDLRNKPFLDKVIPLVEPVMHKIWGASLNAPMLSPQEVVGIQVMSKGSGIACSSLKGPCFICNPYLAYETIEFPELFDDEILLWQVSGKLEIRDIAKNCRCYMIAPMWHSMIMQKYCKLQNLQVMERRFELPSAVGMSVPIEWYNLRARLHKYEKSSFKIKYFLADIRLFDSQQYRLFLKTVFIIRARGLKLKPGTKAYNSFERQYFKLINRFAILPNGKIVFTKDGNPSGSANTTVDNGIVSVAQLAVCWYAAYDSFNGFIPFIQRCAYLTFGDDLIASITCEEDERFFIRLPDIWISLYGSAMKSEIVSNWSEVHFLGAQPIGDVDPYTYLLKPYDVPRLVANLYFKGSRPKDFNPLIELQRALSHRQLLSSTCFTDSQKLLQVLKRCCDSFIKAYNPGLKHSREWQLLVDRHRLSDRDFAFSLTGPELIPDQPRPMLSKTICAQLIVNRPVRIKTLYVMSLSYTQWCEKHTAKIGGLSKADKKKRYNDYVQSSAVNSPKVSAPMRKAKPSSSGVMNTGAGSMGQGVVSGRQNIVGIGLPGGIVITADSINAGGVAWAMALANFWNDKFRGAKIPSPVPLSSMTILTQEVFTAGCPSIQMSTVEPDAVTQALTGAGYFLLRPDTIVKEYTYTTGDTLLGFDPSFTGNTPGCGVWSPPNAGDSFLFTDFSTPFNVENVPTENSWCRNAAFEDIQAIGAKYRATCAGLIARYIGPPITGSGLLAVGRLPKDQLQVLSINPNVNDPTFVAQITGFGFTDFTKKAGVQTGPAMEGGYVGYIPDSIPEFRDLIGVFVGFGAAVVGPKKPGAKVPNRPRRVLGGSEIRKALKRGGVAKLKQLCAPIVNDEGKKGAQVFVRTKTGMTIPMSNPDDLTKLNDAIDDIFPTFAYYGLGINDGAPYPVDIQQDAFSSLCSSINWTGAFAIAQGAADTLTSQQFDNTISEVMDYTWEQDALVVAWNGVAPSDAQALENGWAGNLFEIQKFKTFELIPDQNSFSVAQQPPVEHPVSNSGASQALAAMSSVPNLGVGKTPSTQSTASKVTQGIKTAVSTGTSVAKGVGEVAKIIAEVGGMLGGLF
jgi:hypothetical protein